MRIGQLGVGDLVKERDCYGGALNNIGIITEWHQDGWRVYFVEFQEVFWMHPRSLELLSECR